MYDLAVLGEWAEFALRWLHVITAIAWIGSSFYFIALDLGLRRAADMPEGVHGEEWQVHGGGFYHIQKYLVAPERLPEHLTWFKWESYATWMSGFALLAVMYYWGAEFYLIDPNTADLAIWQAVGISAGSLVLGWFFYDWLCRTRLGENATALMLVLFGFLVLMSWAYAQLFTGRAALLHTGALTATIMSANVFLTIIPNQKIVVADLKAGRKPDPIYGRIAKQRSTHNNYITLPVIFLMLSNHYPLATETEWNWVIASLIFLTGVTIRHYFNSLHAGTGKPHWTWAVTVIIFVAIAWLSTEPGAPGRADAAAELRGSALRLAEAEGFSEVHAIVQGRCAMCHAAEPVWPGLHWAPKGVRFETEADTARQARGIYTQSGLSHAMPPGGTVDLPAADRAAIRDWYRGASGS